MVNLSFKGKKFKIVEKFYIFLCISLAVIIAGFVYMAVAGMNVGIEFSAGATIEVSVKNVNNFDNVAFEKQYENWLKGDRDNDGREDDHAKVFRTSQTQVSTTSGITTFEFRIGTKLVEDGKDVDMSAIVEDEASEYNGKTLLVSYTSDIKTEMMESIKTYFQGKYPEVENVNDCVSINTHTIDNSVMMYTIRNAIIAVSVAIVVILIYIAIRFTWLSGIAAVLALAHDVLVMIAFTTIFQIPVNSTFIAAIITIIGYSINSTIVIFDRVREVEQQQSMLTESDATIANVSIADTLSRSILTNLTTLVVIVLLAIFGNNTIREFAYPIIFGLVAGAYSSVLLSAPLWVKLRKLFRQEGKRTTAKKSKKKTQVDVA